MHIQYYDTVMEGDITPVKYELTLSVVGNRKVVV
jgi:hypothetical protein